MVSKPSELIILFSSPFSGSAGWFSHLLLQLGSPICPWPPAKFSSVWRTQDGRLAYSLTGGQCAGHCVSQVAWSLADWLTLVVHFHCGRRIKERAKPRDQAL